jgi:CheY-like chemotaxis protein
MKKRILLVSVDSDILKAVPLMLRLAGHRVLIADSGLEAIKKARELLPDLILVDAILPDMEGTTVVDILGRLPSTADLRALLLKPLEPQDSRITEAERASLSSSGLLAQITLALCPELESERSGMAAL